MPAKRLVMHTFLLSLQVWMYALTTRERERGRQKRNADILYTMIILIMWCECIYICIHAYNIPYRNYLCLMLDSFPLDCLSVLKRHKSSGFISCHAASSTLQFWFLRIQLPEMILKDVSARVGCEFVLICHLWFSDLLLQLGRNCTGCKWNSFIRIFKDMLSKEVLQADGAA